MWLGPSLDGSSETLREMPHRGWTKDQGSAWEGENQQSRQAEGSRKECVVKLSVQGDSRRKSQRHQAPQRGQAMD